MKTIEKNAVYNIQSNTKYSKFGSENTVKNTIFYWARNSSQMKTPIEMKYDMQVYYYLKRAYLLIQTHNFHIFGHMEKMHFTPKDSKKYLP